MRTLRIMGFRIIMADTITPIIIAATALMIGLAFINHSGVDVWTLEGLALGLICVPFYFLSIVLHEAGHIIAFRLVGVDLTEVVFQDLKVGMRIAADDLNTNFKAIVGYSGGPILSLALTSLIYALPDSRYVLIRGLVYANLHFHLIAVFISILPFVGSDVNRILQGLDGELANGVLKRRRTINFLLVAIGGLPYFIYYVPILYAFYA